MDRRTLLAIVLTAIVIVGTQILFPGSRKPGTPGAPTVRDTVARLAEPAPVPKANPRSASGHRLAIAYSDRTDSPLWYVTHLRVSLENAPVGAALWVRLPEGLTSAENDTTDDIRHLAFASKPWHGDVESTPFAKLDSGKR